MRASLVVLAHVPVELTVELARRPATVAEMLGLSQGGVVKTNRSEDSLVDVRVSGKLVALGQVVIVGEHLGVRILTVINGPEEQLPGDPPPAIRLGQADWSRLSS